MDRDLADLYGVETRVLKQAVRRDIDRFPEDFMFDLSKQEFKKWRSQFVISNPWVRMNKNELIEVFKESNGLAKAEACATSPIMTLFQRKIG